MLSRSRLPLLGALLCVLIAVMAPAAARAKSSSLAGVLSSRELWATIDVCSPADQTNTVGVRGAMPGDGHSGDRMFMSFRLQYLNAATGTWLNLVKGASPSYVAVGPSAAARQGGRSFQLVPVAGRPAVTMRGIVDYQWRRGRVVLQTAERTTTAGHRSLAGADPAGYSAATCLIG